jgi:hypothetical protein
MLAPGDLQLAETHLRAAAEASRHRQLENTIQFRELGSANFGNDVAPLVCANQPFPPDLVYGTQGQAGACHKPMLRAWVQVLTTHPQSACMPGP